MRWRCRVGIHCWDWTRGVGHTRGSSLTGVCQCCPKTKFLKFVDWGERKQQKARLHIPITPQASPPPPPPHNRIGPQATPGVWRYNRELMRAGELRGEPDV